MQIADHTSTGFQFTAEGDQIRRALSARISQHNHEVQDIEEKSAEIQGVPVTEWCEATEKAAAKLRTRRREACVNELAIRSELNDFFDRIDGIERPAASQSAFNEYQTLQVKIATGLKKLGYPDDPDSLNRLADKHPGVCEAKGRYDAVQFTSVSDFRLTNADAYSRANAALESHKQKAVAALSA